MRIITHPTSFRSVAIVLYRGAATAPTSLYFFINTARILLSFIKLLLPTVSFVSILTFTSHYISLSKCIFPQTIIKIIRLKAFSSSSLLDRSSTPSSIIFTVCVMVVLYIFGCFILVYYLRAEGGWFKFVAARK